MKSKTVTHSFFILVLICLFINYYSTIQIQEDANLMIDKHNYLVKEYNELVNVKNEMIDLRITNTEKYNELVDKYNLLNANKKNLTQDYVDLLNTNSKQTSQSLFYVDYYKTNEFMKDLYWTGCENMRGKYVIENASKYDFLCTGSMRPLLSCHNKLTLCKPDKDDLHVGDIIEFEDYYKDEKDWYIIHRIINITDDGMYQTKGDANTYPDDRLINFHNIRGKVDRIE